MPSPYDRTRPHRSPLRRAATWVAGVTAALVLLVSAVGWGLLHYGEGRIDRVDVFGGLADRPERTTDDAVNYLLVGSDTREGVSEEDLRRFTAGSASSAPGRRSDTMIIAHVSKKRDKAVLISLPRDSYVEVPAHTAADGRRVPARKDKLNAAYAAGGPQLAVATVEQATGIPIDHYIEIDFSGFVSMVDALGGVEVCVPSAVRDEKSGLDLPAGRSRVTGVDGLAYVRARYFDSRGDLGRIERQQKFLGAMVAEATSAGVLLNPLKLTRFVNAALDSVQTDPALERSDIVDLATRLRGLSADKVSFLTVPIADDDYRPGAVGSAVLWDEPRAEALFAALRDDDEVGTPARSAARGAAPEVAVAPSRVRVRVLNGSGVTGLGRRAASELTEAGFAVRGAATNAPTSRASTTVIRYDPRWGQSVKTLQAAIPGATLQAEPGLGDTFRVVVGSSWTGPRDVEVAAPRATPAPTPPPVRTAAQDPCA
jgi:LCP family protein required for cell wall assembly